MRVDRLEQAVEDLGSELLSQVVFVGAATLMLRGQPGQVLSEATVQKAGRVLAAETNGSVRVILFGSHARGEADDRSNLDLLVIEREVEDRFAEAARPMAVVGRLGVPLTSSS
jgi:hypothetical protein